MAPDDFQQAWNSQSSGIRVKVDTEMLDAETRRYQKQFTARLFWRDLREIGIALLLVPLWLFLGLRHSLPMAWYLAIPALVWVAGYMLVYRRRSRPKQEEPDDTLCLRLESILTQIESQIRLLKSVHYWGLIPLAVSMLAFVFQVASLTGPPDFFSVIIMWVAAPLFIGCICLAVYLLNQHVVRTDLVPRRDELRRQLQSLQGESTDNEPPVSE